MGNCNADTQIGRNLTLTIHDHFRDADLRRQATGRNDVSHFSDHVFLTFSGQVQQNSSRREGFLQHQMGFHGTVIFNPAPNLLENVFKRHETDRGPLLFDDPNRRSLLLHLQ